jgi:hypothetical protein
MRGIYKGAVEMRLRYLHSKFYKDWFKHSKVGKGHTQTHREHGNLISLLLFSTQSKEVG